jgi:acetyl-CoA carboxylase carboxyltransferase component
MKLWVVQTHNAISGIADYKFKTEQECLDYIKTMMGRLGETKTAGFNRSKAFAPAKNSEEIYSIMSEGDFKAL